ncbi:hypothetical protein [Myceligenerans pegani]|uniref:Uncharacterized protein n=1 Tax=Myceligenerans pegani TaxID=2776917 RepID=A0ABR9MVC6_9MICO|nr:hypothetical protein [Myceligenerans sp. TRM 65318]MBE1874884.1 hypothetical protein [Myceligenerans sp. TRM 65318]MBE3017155.1 hypothetical protein [Myceligenerans sp. TRM 65318]
MTAVPATRPRTVRAAVAAVLIPPAAWVTALGLSYLVQDFACTAYTSSGRPPPSTVIGALVIGLDAVLLALTLAAGAVAWREHRRAAGDDSPLTGFLGLLGTALSLGFAAGIVMIAVNPLVLEVCA